MSSLFPSAARFNRGAGAIVATRFIATFVRNTKYPRRPLTHTSKNLRPARSASNKNLNFAQALEKLGPMTDDYFHHPQRFPKNVEGPFYTTGHPAYVASGGETTAWCGNCLWCGAPEAQAPDLLAPLTEDNSDTYFVRQPQTPEEIDRACSAIEVCCVSALRYGGKDTAIIQRLHNDPSACDFIIDSQGSLVSTVDSQGNLLSFAKAIVAANRARREKELTPSWFLRLLKRLVSW